MYNFQVTHMNKNNFYVYNLLCPEFFHQQFYLRVQYGKHKLMFCHEKKEFLKLVNLWDSYLILNSERNSTEEMVRQVDKILINGLDNKVLKKERGRL